MKRYKDKNLNGLEFDNISDFKRYLDKNKDSKNTKSLTRWGSWSGVKTWTEFETYLEEGNKEITKELKQYTKVYIDKFEHLYTSKSDYILDVVGEFFDIGAYMTGEPECWIKQIEVKDDKFIELNIQGTYPHNEDLTKVRENASKLMAIATILQEHKHLVRINVVFRSIGSYNKNHKLVTEAKMTVKDYNQPLDFKKFGIMLGIPMFRRGFLRLIEIEYDNNVTSRYGQPLNMENDISLSNTKDLDNLENRLKGD